MRDGRNESKADWVIQTRDLEMTYQVGDHTVPVLRGVSLKIASGDFVALIGASGSGKSTLLHLLGCLDTPTSGSYLLDGQEVSRLSGKARARVRNGQIGFVFQSFNLLPTQTALENVVLPLLYNQKAGDRRERAREVLARVGLSHRTNHRPAQLSGGERQRVAIARALVTRPSIILADEPTGNLDSATGREVLDLIIELHAEGRTIVLVTHDPEVAASAQFVLTMRDGTLVEPSEKPIERVPWNGSTDDVD